jgi:hypothetical protein
VAVLAPTVVEVEEAAAEEAILEPEVIGRGKEEDEESGRTRREEEKE